jgi:hypothetical protein
MDGRCTTSRATALHGDLSIRTWSATWKRSRGQSGRRWWLLHVLASWCICCSGRAVPVGNVEVVKSSIERLYPRHRNLGFLSQLQWCSEVCLNFHGAPGFVVEPHGAVSLLGLCHFLDCCFPEVGGKCAVLSRGKGEQLVEYTVNQSAHANLFHQFGVFGSFEDDAGWVEGNWTANELEEQGGEAIRTYPIMRSYCCWRMLGETLQSTCPEPRVMARASAMSAWICAGMLGLVLAGPTQMSVAPLCSNSLAPICEISAPETKDKTTLVGKRCSRYDSTPRLCVVFIRMHVCCGETTDSMMLAMS